MALVVQRVHLILVFPMTPSEGENTRLRYSQKLIYILDSLLLPVQAAAQAVEAVTVKIPRCRALLKKTP